MRKVYPNNITMDPSGFVLLSDYVPHIIQEIRYFSTYNFIGERIDGYEEPCALITKVYIL
jgi:D-alanyl-D-alanine dipeptidase